MSGASKRDLAEGYAEAGFRVFPLAPNSKLPAHAHADWSKIASRDPQRVHAMWTCPVFESELDYNIGVALGPNDLVVDVDVRDGKKGAETLALVEAIYGHLPSTSTFRTASGGEHRFYRVPGISGCFPKRLGADIDLKGEGGYVVGAGSTIHGQSYEPSNAEGIAKCPRFIMDLAKASPRERRAINDVPRLNPDPVSTLGDPARAVAWLTDRAPEAVQGAGGDLETYKVAAKMREFGADRSECLELMLDHWNEQKASPPWSPDELEQKIENAYRYGQNAPGIASPEAEFDAVEIDVGKTDVTKKNSVLEVRNANSFPWSVQQAPPLVKGLLNYGMLAMMSGPSNAGKSPLALDLLAHIAKGEPWRGMKVRKGYCLYISTEGWTGLGNRMEALRRTHFENVQGDVPLEFQATSLDLQKSGRDAARIIETITRRAAHFGVPVALVVIDTLSHVLGGGDESNPEHARAVIQNCQRIAKTGAAVMLLHHPTKDGASIYRGSSLWLNDIDLLLSVEHDRKTDIRTLATPRVKEFAEIKKQRFSIKVVHLGTDPDGDDVTSVVVEWKAAAEAEFADSEMFLSDADKPAFDWLKEHSATVGRGARFTEWFVGFERVRGGDPKSDPAAKSAFKRKINKWVAANLVIKNERNQYVIPN